MYIIKNAVLEHQLSISEKKKDQKSDWLIKKNDNITLYTSEIRQIQPTEQY